MWTRRLERKSRIAQHSNIVRSQRARQRQLLDSRGRRNVQVRLRLRFPPQQIESHRVRVRQIQLSLEIMQRPPQQILPYLGRLVRALDLLHDSLAFRVQLRVQLVRLLLQFANLRVKIEEHRQCLSQLR